MSRKDDAIAEAWGHVAGTVDAETHESIERALNAAYDLARGHAHGCISEDCSNPGFDYARLTLSTPSGAMQVEVLMCELCLSTLEMLNHGSYLLLRRKA